MTPNNLSNDFYLTASSTAVNMTPPGGGRRRNRVYLAAVMTAALVLISAVLFLVTPRPSTSTSQSGKFDLVFTQVRVCPPDSALANEWEIPWVVTLSNGMQAAQPSNDTSRATENSLGYSGTTNSSYSTITFSVPDGNYSYEITPAGSGGLEPSSGSVVVDGHNATVDTDFAPKSCGFLVATVTVTTTITTQASQATTTYAIPTTNCTISPIITTTITTITIGPEPPVSTTTITVTTTSTSYTQTVTLTSCTYSAPTVTFTVTTTANP